MYHSKEINTLVHVFCWEGCTCRCDVAVNLRGLSVCCTCYLATRRDLGYHLEYYNDNNCIQVVSNVPPICLVSINLFCIATL